MSQTPPRTSSHASRARWGVTIAAMVAIALGSLLPAGALGLPIDVEPHIKHLIAYGFLGTMLVLATRADWPGAFGLAGLLVIAGIVIEILQIFIPGRSFMWLDIATSSLGAFSGVVLGRFVQWFVR